DGYPWWMFGVVMFAMYSLGLVLAPLVAFCLKGTLLRGRTPVFVMEMPSYKWPSLFTVVRRVWDAGGSFLKRAGTIILASMILVWFLLNYPGNGYPEKIAALEATVKEERAQAKELEEPIADDLKKLAKLEREKKRATGARLEEIEAEIKELKEK